MQEVRLRPSDTTGLVVLRRLQPQRRETGRDIVYRNDVDESRLDATDPEFVDVAVVRPSNTAGGAARVECDAGRTEVRALALHPPDLACTRQVDQINATMDVEYRQIDDMSRGG